MKLIPTGIENFKDLMDNDAYYMDKSSYLNGLLFLLDKNNEY